MEDFIDKIYEAETGPERTSGKAIMSYKMLVESKADLNKSKTKVKENIVSRKTYSKYNILDKKVISAKHQRGKISAMMLELLRRIHDNKEIKARNRMEQFVPDEDYAKKKKKRYASTQGGSFSMNEEVHLNKINK